MSRIKIKTIHCYMNFEIVDKLPYAENIIEIERDIEDRTPGADGYRYFKCGNDEDGYRHVAVEIKVVSVLDDSDEEIFHEEYIDKNEAQQKFDEMNDKYGNVEDYSVFIGSIHE